MLLKTTNYYSFILTDTNWYILILLNTCTYKYRTHMGLVQSINQSTMAISIMPILRCSFSRAAVLSSCIDFAIDARVLLRLIIRNMTSSRLTINGIYISTTWKKKLMTQNLQNTQPAFLTQIAGTAIILADWNCYDYNAQNSYFP